MHIKDLLGLIPHKYLSVLAIDMQTDRYAKKLQAEVIFKLLLYCIISYKDNSLRMMESAYETVAFQLLNKGRQHETISFSSISERLSVIKVSYFEKLYKYCVAIYKQHIYSYSERLMRFDSTIVTLSARLLQTGYQLRGGDAEKLRQLKFTIGYSSIPELVNCYHQPSYSSENVAMKETILMQATEENQSIKVFDRGLNARQSFDEFTDNNIFFVTRINEAARYKIIKQTNPNVTYPLKTQSLQILSDELCFLYGLNKKKTKHCYRRIETVRLENDKPIIFLTNIEDMTAEQIAEIYKRRWDIEVFFKFIKGLLNFSHLINRSENGIKVMLYVTMIAAIFLQSYKEIKQLHGFKIARLKLANEIETEIIKNLITLCGGNSQLINTLDIKNTS